MKIALDMSYPFICVDASLICCFNTLVLIIVEKRKYISIKKIILKN